MCWWDERHQNSDKIIGDKTVISIDTCYYHNCMAGFTNINGSYSSSSSLKDHDAKNSSYSLLIMLFCLITGLSVWDTNNANPQVGSSIAQLL